MFTKLEVIAVLSLYAATTAWTQEGAAVWRCGNEYTHQPKAGQVCTRVQVQADVVTTAPRKFHAVPQSASSLPPMPVVIEGPRLDGATQQLSTEELRKQQKRLP